MDQVKFKLISLILNPWGDQVGNLHLNLATGTFHCTDEHDEIDLDGHASPEAALASFREMVRAINVREADMSEEDAAAYVAGLRLS